MAMRSSILNVADQAQGVIPYLRSLDAELIWTPGRDSKAGIDWSKNTLSPTAQNTGDLTLSTGPYPPRIIGGQSVCEFGGTNGYIDFGDEPALEFTTAFTAIVCVKFDSWPAPSGDDFDGIIGKYFVFEVNEKSWGLVLHGNFQRISLVFGNSAGAYTGQVYTDLFTNYDLDTWYVIAARYDGGLNSAKIYIDGVDETVGQFDSIPSTLYTGVAPVEIGAQNAGSLAMDGSIALAAVLGTALTEGEIQAATELILRGA